MPADPLAGVGCTDLEPIASGGYSVVYRARQAELGRPVALKVLNLGVGDERGRRRFERELDLVGRLTGHPNVVTVYGNGILPDGRGYVMMEYCPGGSLADRLESEGAFPVRDVVSIGVKICGVLELAAREGIVHRDVKPANILVTRFGEPALSDFGVAVAAGERAGATTGALTPAHAAPEMLEGREGGAAADQWSLASTLYTLLAGRPPFAAVDGEGMLTGMLRVLNDPVPSIPRGDLPEGLPAVLGRAMAKDPAQRWPTAGDFGRALQEIERSEGWPVTVLPDREVPDGHRRPPERPVEVGGSTSLGTAPVPVASEGHSPVFDGKTRTWAKRDSPPAEEPDRAPASRRGLWVGAGGVTLGLVAVAVAVAVVVSGGSTPPSKPKPPPHHLRTPDTPAKKLVPRDVQVVSESSTSVTLHWVDPSHGSDAYVVKWAGGVDTNTTETQAVVPGLDASKGYCFVVAAVYAETKKGVLTADAPPVCIRGATPPPTDQAS